MRFPFCKGTLYHGVGVIWPIPRGKTILRGDLSKVCPEIMGTVATSLAPIGCRRNPRLFNTVTSSLGATPSVRPLAPRSPSPKIFQTSRRTEGRYRSMDANASRGERSISAPERRVIHTLWRGAPPQARSACRRALRHSAFAGPPASAEGEGKTVLPVPLRRARNANRRDGRRSHSSSQTHISRLSLLA